LSASWTISGTDGTLYTVVTDLTTTYLAVITGAVTDEIFGTFNTPGLIVDLTRADLQTKTTLQGLYAIAGYPVLSFPKLSSMGYTVSYTLEAPGYRDYPLTVPIPQNTLFPVAAPSVPLRRLPVRLQGRVVSDTTGLAIAGSLVVAVDNPTPPPPPVPHTMLLRTPLYVAHANNAPVQQVTMTAGALLQLAQPAKGGSATVTLQSVSGVAAGSLLRFETPALTQVEYAQVQSLGPIAGQVNLTTALNRSYGVGAAAAVNLVTAALTGAVAHLVTDANAGDGILVADTLLQVSTLAIDAGSAAVEYHEVGAIADSNGYYGFDGVGRVQELFLEANGTTPATAWMIEFDQATNIVDFRI
jgi:hypothetical protein